jgi:hypothetical protein
MVAFSTSTLKVPLLFKLLTNLPVWLNHTLFVHSVLDGDAALLHQQEHKLVEEDKRLTKAADGTHAPSAWRRLFYLPTRSDTLTAAFRKWLETRGNGGPFGPLHLHRCYSPLISDRRVLLDRYASHTQHCQACKRALSLVERCRLLAAAWAVVAVAASVTRAVASGVVLSSAVVHPAIAGLVGWLFFAALSGVRNWFYYTGYDHAVM